MHSSTLLLIAVAACTVTASGPVAAHITPAPRAADPEGCPTRFLTQEGVDVPKPTGDLSMELNSYGWKLFKSCITEVATNTATITATTPDLGRCPDVDLADWCAFTDAAPASVLPAYSAYASQAYTWWEDNAQDLINMRDNCPNTFKNGKWRDGDGERLVDDTFAIAHCYADVLAKVEETQTTTTGWPVATEPAVTPSSTITEQATRSPSETAAPSETSTGGVGYMGAEMWMVALAGAAAVAVGCEL
ncbi:hypothetical protein O988_06802 [Pseudogymnoascus sp. VKM F-3808]|nr:hypothetical protein O988_06802 [Pseudogymnoascus sp. VKM F-3808]